MSVIEERYSTLSCDQPLNKHVLVIGGLGFLGKHLAEFLTHQGAKVRIMDIHKKKDDPKLNELGIEYYSGSICNIQDLKKAMNGVDTVFHTASLTDPLREYNEFQMINIKGTTNVISACLECGVTQLIYTSSSAVVDDGSDLRGVDESVRYPKKYLDHYGKTKAEAERIVLAANGKLNCK